VSLSAQLNKDFSFQIHPRFITNSDVTELLNKVRNRIGFAYPHIGKQPRALKHSASNANCLNGNIE
jgi:hypothetical protein